MKKHYFPMFIDLTDKKVVVAGAGTIAKRRIRSLIEFTDHLVVIAPEVNKELKDLEAEGKLTILRKRYEREDIYDASMGIMKSIQPASASEFRSMSVRTRRNVIFIFRPWHWGMISWPVSVRAAGIIRSPAQRSERCRSIRG